MAKKPVKYFVADAFADTAFKGNQAAICLLEEEREDEWLQDLAVEFNVQTCYLMRLNDEEETNDSLKPPKFNLRWFSTISEDNFCGHGTLAAAHVIFSSGLVNSNIIEFSTRSGILTAKKVLEVNQRGVSNAHNGESQESYYIELDFPAIHTVELNSPADISSISQALNVASIVDVKMLKAEINDVLVVLPSQKDVVDFQPNFDEIKKCPGAGLIITGLSPAESKFDFYSRYFCPKIGNNEDRVCARIHCALAVYWAEKLGKTDLVAYMASPRGGTFLIHPDDQKRRVLMGGKAATTMEGVVLA